MQYRHGDLLVEKVDAIPKAAVPKKDNILAYGTATGHSHRLTGGGVVLEENGDIYLNVPDEGALTHEEHNAIALPAGKYRVIRQVEYNPYERVTRMVMD